MQRFQWMAVVAVCAMGSASPQAARAQNGFPLGAERAKLTEQVNAQLSAAKKVDPNLAILQTILKEPEGSIDFAKAEVAIEKMVDPHVNEAETLKKLDALAAAVRARFPNGDATDTEVKAGLLLSTLKDPGPWNDNRPFAYDLDNPLGLVPEDKLLSHYLVSRKGNCVSMPVLFVVLGQKLGLPVILSSAPEHNFAKLRRDNGTWLNIEATSYGTKSDESYERELNISPRALQTGIYLQTSTQKQSVLLMANTLMQFYRYHRSPEELMGLTTLVILADSNNLSAWIWRGQAYFGLQDAKYKKFGSPQNVPPAMQHDYWDLEQLADQMYKRAENLGWTPETSEDKAKYLQMVQQVKASKQGG